MSHSTATTTPTPTSAVFVVATWFELWDALHAAAPDVFDHTTGRPFTLPRDTAREVPVRCDALSAAQIRVVRRAAAVWGGRLDTDRARLTHCYQGWPPAVWDVFVA